MSYLSKKGHAHIDRESCPECTVHEAELSNGTKMQIFQMGSGLQYTFDLACNFSAFLGCGLTYSFLWIKNDSHFVERKVEKNCFGGILKSGLSYYFYQSFHGDLFLDCSVTKFGVKNFDYATVNFGVGLGAEF